MTPVSARIMALLKEYDHGQLQTKERNNNTAQVHFSYLTEHVDFLVTEETIRNLFIEFGEIDDVTIKKSVVDGVVHSQSGYGFIHFPMNEEGIRSAIRATSVIRQVLIGEILFDSCLTRPLVAMLQRQGRPTALNDLDVAYLRDKLHAEKITPSNKIIRRTDHFTPATATASHSPFMNHYNHFSAQPPRAAVGAPYPTAPSAGYRPTIQPPPHYYYPPRSITPSYYPPVESFPFEESRVSSVTSSTFGLMTTTTTPSLEEPSKVYSSSLHPHLYTAATAVPIQNPSATTAAALSFSTYETSSTTTIDASQYPFI